MVGVIAFVIIIIWLTLVGALYVITAFGHTRKSVFVLALLFPLSVGAARVLTPAIIPQVSGTRWFWAVTAVFTPPIYVGLALATVEVWKYSKVSEFERQISRLEERESSLLERLEEIKTLMSQYRVKEQENNSIRRARASEAESSRKYLDMWLREGGAARIRALKIEEWEKEFSAMDVEEIRSRLGELETQLESLKDRPGEEDRSNQVRAQKELARCHLLGRPDASEDGLLAIASCLKGLVEEENMVKSRLRELREEISEWKKRRDAVSSGRTILN